MALQYDNILAHLYQEPPKPQYPPVYHAPATATAVSPKPTVLLQADSAVSHLPPLIAASSLEHQILRDKESTAKLGRVLEQFKNRSVLSLMGADFKVSGPYFVVTPQPQPGREKEHHQSSISFPQ